MALSHQSLAGPGYIILNVLRVMNIIGLLAVITASIVMLVKTVIVSQFFFFDAVTHVITALGSMFLVVTETSLVRNYVVSHWPLFGPDHGFVTLGCTMIILGIDILGNLNKQATSQETLGLAFWRIVIGSGIIIFVLGFFNIAASYVFRDTSRGITARKVRSYGAIAPPSNADEEAYTATPKPPASYTASEYSRATYSPVKARPFTPQTTGTSAMKSPWKSAISSPARTLRFARDSLLPSYHSRESRPERDHHPFSFKMSRPSTSSSGSSKKKHEKRESVGPRIPINISAPLNVNPQFAHLVKPNLAHHPSVRRGESQEPLRYKFEDD